MKKAIAMKCTKEQFEAIKPKLKGIEIGCISNFNEWNYLVNNEDGNPSVVCNTGESGSKRQNREIHETWNESVFLEACGIEVEETYQITKEQILKLENGFTTDNLYKWFPEAFEVKLEVGKWYKGFDNLFCYQEGRKVFGFNEIGWERLSGISWIWKETKNVIEATKEEVFKVLKNEAVKRGFVEGVYIDKLLRHNEGTLKPGFLEKQVSDESFCFNIIKNYLFIGNLMIFDNGTWATIIEKKTKEEAEKLLNCKIV